MLYIEDTDGRLWLSVVDVLREREPYDMVLCLYADSAEDEFAEPFSEAETYEYLDPVTPQAEEDELTCSARVRVSDGLLETLRLHVGDFEDWGDSFALYPLHERTWMAAFIPHKRMILVSEPRLYDFLDAAGIPVLYDPPESWSCGSARNGVAGRERRGDVYRSSAVSSSRSSMTSLRSTPHR